MPSRNLVRGASLASLLNASRTLADSIGLRKGKVFLVLEHSSLEEMKTIESHVALPHFFLCGKVKQFDSLCKTLNYMAPLDFFLTDAGTKNRRIISFKHLDIGGKGYLDIEGSPSTQKLADSAELRYRGDNFTVLFESRDEVLQYMEAALSDFRKDSDHHVYWSQAYGNFYEIAELAKAGAIEPSSDLKGYLGFRPPGAPRTNVHPEALPDLVVALDRMTTGKIELVQQIIGLGGKQYESWNVLNLKKDNRIKGEAILELYSLNSIPSGLQKAIEQRLRSDL